MTAPAAVAETQIVLVAGRVRPHDAPGHHDYKAGCALMGDLLARLPAVRPVLITNGWPDDETVFDAADAILFYDGGGGKQAFLHDEARVQRLQQVVARGTGLVMLHQAVAFPRRLTALGQAWLGGVYVPGESKRGHWKSTHDDFPPHPITQSVVPWAIRDGWLRRLRFVDDLHGVTPLIWSGKQHSGSAQGGTDDITGWAYQRPDGGRSFAFTGLDAHSAWAHPGLRRLIVNGLLWTAKHEVPVDPAWAEIEPAALKAYLTPRKSRAVKILRALPNKARRALRGERKW